MGSNRRPLAQVGFDQAYCVLRIEREEDVKLVSLNRRVLNLREAINYVGAEFGNEYHLTGVFQQWM